MPLPRAIACGLLFGLAFVVRFQTCLMIGPGLIAMLVARRIGARDLALILAGIAAAIAAGLAIDAWGYGELVCSQCNYVGVNFFEGKANAFGVAPWWDYFRGYLVEFTFPAGLVVFCAGLAGMLMLWRDPLAWFFIPNVVAHFLISHKEPRFLFPHLFLALPLFFIALDGRYEWARIPRVRRLAMLMLLCIVALWNALLVIPAAVSPADDTVGLLEEMRDSGVSDAEIAYVGSSPAKAWNVIPYGIYSVPDGVAISRAENIRDAVAVIERSEGPPYLTMAMDSIAGQAASGLEDADCILAWETPANRIARLFPPLGRAPGLLLVRPQPRALCRCDRR
jgi:phosphatidylinositol glycan class B